MARLLDRENEEKPEASIGKQNLFKARLLESLPWIVSPLHLLKGKDKEYFHVRHEASMIELFFDLFFVANLATFTSYHEITNWATVLDYIGFFAIMWSTWFHITIHDVRFGPDCVYERMAKIAQFIVFVLFAAVGSSFSPGSTDSPKDYRMYQTMAMGLGISRMLLAIQHAVVAMFVCGKYREMKLPLAIIICTYLTSGITIFATFAMFNRTTVSFAYVVWYSVMVAEAIVIVAVSSIWRMLSFKETHMNERLSLLTMIVIGEGCIGVSKTAGYLWPTTYAPSIGSVVAILSIVVMLFMLWQTYFDNHPHGDYGTIKQQWWALAHFFLHLGYVGVVEGSNQLAIYFYATKTVHNMDTQMRGLCDTDRANNTLFTSTMTTTLDKLKIPTYDPKGYDKIQDIFTSLVVEKGTLPCHDNSDTINEDIFDLMRTSVFTRFGIHTDGVQSETTFHHTFSIAFKYYWLSLSLIMVTLLVFLYIVRRQKLDWIEWIRMGWRLCTAFICILLMCISYMDGIFILFISSPWVVPTAVGLMAITVLVDRIARWCGIRHFKWAHKIPPLTSKDHDHRHGPLDISLPTVGIKRAMPIFGSRRRPVSTVQNGRGEAASSSQIALTQNPTHGFSKQFLTNNSSYASVSSDDALQQQQQQRQQHQDQQQQHRGGMSRRDSSMESLGILGRVATRGERDDEDSNARDDEMIPYSSSYGGSSGYFDAKQVKP